MVQQLLHRLVLIWVLSGLGLALGGNDQADAEKVQGNLELAPRRELLRKEGRENEQSMKASPAAFKEYRFSVDKTRKSGQSVFDISELFLLDQAGEALPLNTPNTVLSITNSQVISSNPRNLVDNNPATSIRLTTNQTITLKLQQMGVLVAGFGFKTSQNEDGNGFDPISFRLEGSMDGSSWYLLNQKAGYSTPEARGALVGPFMVSKLTALALQGDKTLPASAFPTTVPVPPPVPSAALGVVSTGSMHRPFDRATVSGSLSTQGEHKDIAAVGALRATTITSTLPSAPKVAAAVLDASASVGLDKADAAATVAAVAAVEAVTAAPSTAAARLAQAATAAGLAPEQVEMVTATLQSVDQSHWEAVVEAWTAVAAKKAQAQSAEDKVAAVVSASGEAGLTVAQQAAAAATSANAAAARVAETVAATSPLKMVGEALEGAELQPEGKAAVADAAAKERPDNQEAIAHVLRAAGIMATTTMLPMVDVTDPDARVILEAVVQKLANASVDPQEKVKIANAAAEAYVKGRASTTSVDGVGMIVRAAEALGLAHAQVKRMAETAEQLTVAEQLAAATALRAASEGPDVLGPEDPADKVAAVVKAEAAAGVPEAEQAEAAAAAVTVAAKKAKKAKEAEEEGEILNRIVAEALKIGLDEDQAEAILETVSAMSSEEQAVIERYLISLLSPETVVTTTGDLKTEPVVTTAVSTSTSMTPAAPGSATFRFSVVPSTPLSRSEFVKILLSTPSNCELRCQGINLDSADLSKLDLRFINFKMANLRKTDLWNANLSNCCLERANLSGAHMDGAILSCTRLQRAHMEGASLRGCNFEDPAGTRANLEGVNLKNSDLEGSQLGNVNLRVATLKGANLQNCILRGAVLAGADLENCNLTGCDLQDANLRGANITGATIKEITGPLHMTAFVRNQLPGSALSVPATPDS